ncbi:MAG: FhaA domain-containing protein [Chloroflexia bacterium]
MNALQRFENFMERTLEGSFTRLFRSSVQPAEVARRIERAMENNLTVGVGRQYTPNEYKVRLNAADFAAFEPYRPRLERELAAFVRETAQERGWDLLARPRVSLTAADDVSRHGIDVEARLVDGPNRAADALELAEYQPTTAMPIMKPRAPAPAPRSRSAAPAPAAQSAQPPATLSLLAGSTAGSTVLITGPLTGLGRELDNDLVIEDSRVSRHHAQIIFQHNRYAVRDLGSTNGTFVNGRQVATCVLAPGDRISLGGFELQLTI